MSCHPHDGVFHPCEFAFVFELTIQLWPFMAFAFIRVVSRHTFTFMRPHTKIQQQPMKHNTISNLTTNNQKKGNMTSSQPSNSRRVSYTQTHLPQELTRSSTLQKGGETTIHKQCDHSILGYANTRENRRHNNKVNYYTTKRGLRGWSQPQAPLK